MFNAFNSSRVAREIQRSEVKMLNLSMSSNRLLLSVSIGLGATLVSGVAYWYWFRRGQRSVMPEKWIRIGTLEQINIFPIKSCAPLKLEKSAAVECDLLGLKWGNVRDRVFMLIDDNREMVTARAYPRMVLIAVTVVGPTSVRFSAPEMISLELNFKTLASEHVATAVWDTKVDARSCGKVYDKWFSKFILGSESGLHLVQFPHVKPVRDIKERLLKEPFMTRADTGTFNDSTSYMLINLASIDDLNARLQRPVDPLQFRGNFHLKMDENVPYAEDKWGWMRIGEKAVFRHVAPCTRCIFPNINVRSGERDPDGEPSKTLKSYRQFSGYLSPSFGIHLGLRQTGTVQVGDVVYVQDFS